MRDAAAYQWNEVLLSARNVSVSLAGRVVLRELELEIRNRTRPGKTTGQIVALLGPSGMAKPSSSRSSPG